MYYNASMNTHPLNPMLAKELLDLGQWLRTLRKKRKITIEEMCVRIGVKNPRTVSKIEKGDPTVSLGTFIEYINILGLARNVSERILGDYISVVTDQKRKPVFKDEDMNF